MSNFNYNILNSTENCYQFVFKIYPIGRPEPLILSTGTANVTFSPDELPIFTGKSEAQTSSKSLKPTPTNLIEIASSAIDSSWVISREIVGALVEVDVVVSSSVDTVLPVLRGVIGTARYTGTFLSLEIVSIVEDLKTPNPYVLSSSCMNSLGELKCTLSKQSIVFAVSATTSVLDSKKIGIIGDYIFAPNNMYELLIGFDAYSINVNESTPSIIVVDRIPLSLPHFVTIQRNCNRSITQCRKYLNVSQYNGNNFLATAGLNYAI